MEKRVFHHRGRGGRVQLLDGDLMIQDLTLGLLTLGFASCGVVCKGLGDGPSLKDFPGAR